MALASRCCQISYLHCDFTLIYSKSVLMGRFAKTMNQYRSYHSFYISITVKSISFACEKAYSVTFLEAYTSKYWSKYEARFSEIVKGCGKLS